MGIEKISLGAGCFWGVEHILGQQEGVLKTTVGYTGGQTENPTYRDICTGTTGHAEVVEVEYDTEKIATEELLNFFWRLHDPTQLNRQGVDMGTQYRSVIYCYNGQQKEIAKNSKNAFDESGVFSTKAVTQIEEAVKFYPAEEYHQDYFGKNGGMICHYLREK